MRAIKSWKVGLYIAMLCASAMVSGGQANNYKQDAQEQIVLYDLVRPPVLAGLTFFDDRASKPVAEVRPAVCTADLLFS